jgi:hypothetical protein
MQRPATECINLQHADTTLYTMRRRQFGTLLACDLIDCSKSGRVKHAIRIRDASHDQPAHRPPPIECARDRG